MVNTIRMVILATTFLYGGIVLVVQISSASSDSASYAIHTQQLADMGRRVERLETMAIGERLTKIETQIEAAANAADRTSSMVGGALLCLLGLVGETVMRLIGARSK